ncbi:YccF domain-containing protein [Nocardia sp. NPDC058666]|uniref:YccF domain-containing protein n=1 Tax=Nocardia sp. NPDC058666 TaxID=3346587 RepID=UPI00364E3CF1
MKLVQLILNILWVVLCGFWMALGYLLAAVICFILIVTIPFGIASLRLAGYVLWPFGRTVVDKPTAGAGSLVGNVIWFVFAGWWLALGHVFTSIALAITIIGLPFAWANLKLVPLSLFPLGHEVVPAEQAR